MAARSTVKKQPSALQAQLERQGEQIAELKTTVAELKTTVAVLESTVNEQKAASEKRDQRGWQLVALAVAFAGSLLRR